MEEKNQIAEILKSAKNIAIIPSRIAGTEAFIAGVGLYHLLKNAEKTVSLIYPGKVPDDFVDTISSDEITSEPGKRELIVAIDYSQTPASKVHYSTKDDILRLSISPVNKDFDFSNITTFLQGFDFDVVITIGAQALDDLGQTYRDLEDVISSATVVNLDNTAKNTRFGTISLVDILQDNLSMLVLNNFGQWGLKLDHKAAKALLGGAMYRAAL